MKTQIKLSKELSIPLDIVTHKSAMMGGNGGGKSYAAMKTIEEILRANGWVTCGQAIPYLDNGKDLYFPRYSS